MNYFNLVIGSLPQPQDFVWTWNFILTAFLTIVVLPVIAKVIINAIKRHLTSQDIERDKKDEEIKRLVAERESTKEKAIIEWRERFSKQQCEIKENLDVVGRALLSKMNIEDHDDLCKENMDTIWERVNHHSHDEGGHVVIKGR